MNMNMVDSTIIYLMHQPLTKSLHGGS